MVRYPVAPDLAAWRCALGYPKLPASDSNFDSNRDSNGGGRPEAEWTPVESGAEPTPRPAYVHGRRWTPVGPR
jgi:hypothetical protein